MASSQAGYYTIAKYLGRTGTLPGGLTTDDWDPSGGVGDAATFTPKYTVTIGGNYPTVQSAVTAAVAAGGTTRVYILVSPGTYNEVVCVPANAPPITLYSANTDPTQTSIASDHYSSQAVGSVTNGCTGTSGATYGTDGSATFAVYANGFQAENMTFANTASVATLNAASGPQGVALITAADKIALENVRVTGHQDALEFSLPTGSTATVVRAYVKNSFISGDTDFIFGNGTAVLDNCEVQYVSDRKNGGNILAPDTDARNPYGILVTNSNFTADSVTASGVTLGRAWDHNCTKPSGTGAVAYMSNCVDASTTGDYPNGQALVASSTLGPHINTAAPWTKAATTGRAYSSTPVSNCDGAGGTCPANRLYEYQDTP